MRKLLLFLGFVVPFVVPHPADGMPMYARRYGMECSACHGPIPRLNENGYSFRAAGARSPGEIGKTESPEKWGDFASFRLQFKAQSLHAESAAGAKTTSNQLVFHEATFYPLTGAWAKNWSSLAEVSFEPDGVNEIENGYVRYDWGTEKAFYLLRAGIMHPFEGYGAADRPISIARPLFETSFPKFQNTSSPYSIWGLDQFGVEGGLDYDRFSGRLAMFNGLNDRGEPAVGGELTKTVGLPSSNAKDFQAYVNYILHENSGGISGLFYHGTADQHPAGAADGVIFKNSFNRMAGFASYPVALKLNVQAGVEYGTDKHWDPDLEAVADANLKSFGAFGSADYQVHEKLWLGARYDVFDPNTDADDNTVSAVTGYLNWPLNTGLQFIAQFQHKETQSGRNASNGLLKARRNDAEVRGIFIW